MINYNYDKYIGEAIESVLVQTYENIELIIIDDGSTDNSRKKIGEYVKQDKRIKFLKQKNKGVVPTRNRALKEKKGEFFVFVDADDIIPPDFIQKMYTSLIKNNADVAYCDLQQFDKLHGLLKIKAPSIDGLLEFQATPVCQMVRSSVLGETRFDFKLNKIGYEDADFFFRLFFKNAKFSKTSVKYYYRIHGNGRSPEFTTEAHYKGRLYIYKKLESFDPRIQKAFVDIVLKIEKESKFWHKIADERLHIIKEKEDVIKEKEDVIKEKDKAINDIINSKKYRIMTKFAKILKKLKIG